MSFETRKMIIAINIYFIGKVVLQLLYETKKVSGGSDS
jgi:hypothetical protein